MNPVMDIAVFNKLQELVFASYGEALDLFITEIAPYYFIDFSYKSLPEQDHPELIIDRKEFEWFSELFQELIVLGASLSDFEIHRAKDNFFRLIDTHETGMKHYDSDEAKSIIHKIFMQSMYLNGFIDEINSQIKIPSYRYRTKNGMVLNYSPSLPLQSLSSIICEKFKIYNEYDIKIVDNFCVFYWNLRAVQSELKQIELLEKYIQSATVKLKTETVNLLEDIGDYIEFVMSDDFIPGDDSE